MFPGAQEFKHKVLWICKPGETDVQFTVLRPIIYLKPATPDKPAAEWRLQFTIPKADQDRFQEFLAGCDQTFGFIFESPWARYKGEGKIQSGPKPYIALPVHSNGLTRICELTEADRLERAGTRAR